MTIQVVYNLEEPPETITRSLFLAGPTPREASVESWRKQALFYLEKLHFDGVVFVPEQRDGGFHGDKAAQIEWEDKCLNMADCIVFWVPRDLETLPGFTTNVEFGRWENSPKIVFGAPKDAPKNSYLQHYVEKHGGYVHDNLISLLDEARVKTQYGEVRTAGERFVPLHIWRTTSFQNWYASLKAAGNTLHSAREEWTYRVGENKQIVFFWILYVDVYIASEDRHKTNEVVIARPDISVIVAYAKQGEHLGWGMGSTKVILIREFRSPVNNPDGYVYELPGGSSFKAYAPDPLVLAADELYEETGIRVPSTRIREYGSRQMVATMSAHQAHLFAVRLATYEIEEFENRIKDGLVCGVEEDTERTYPMVTTFGDIMQRQLLDWSMIGMLSQVLYGEPYPA